MEYKFLKAVAAVWNGEEAKSIEKSIKNDDVALKRNSTETRYNQYIDSRITREKAEEYAITRMRQRKEKELKETLKHLEECGNIEAAENITIMTMWIKNRTWGWNPHIEVFCGNFRHTATASGCGYDKESTAVAEALNQCNKILKILYDAKEKSLAEGENISNVELLGYGSGYEELPRFEGGVGMSSILEIFRKRGYSVSENHGTNSSYYKIDRVCKSNNANM